MVKGTFKGRVLLCDGERHVANLLRTQLRRQGYEVRAVADGEAAVDALRATPFDRVFLDYDLPKRDGYEVLKWIRTHAETEALWVALKLPEADMDEHRSGPYRADSYLPIKRR